MKKIFQNKDGFTLLEILLVTGIVIILLSTIIPLAIRVNTSSKYTIVRQAAAEIGKWGLEWGTRNLEGQDPLATCVLNDYISTLGNNYVGDLNNGNWVIIHNTPSCRPNTNALLYSVADMIDPGRQPRNPFNGASYFAASGSNSGTNLTAGLLYLAQGTVTVAPNPPSHYYYFVFTGTESRNPGDWHAGMGTGTPPPINNMRNGIYMTRLVQ